MSSLEAEIAFKASEQLARSGREAEAVQNLVRAADAGHIEAETALAGRLLTGRGVRFTPDEGIRRLIRAAGAGGGEAAARLATLHAMGSGVPQSYDLALTNLVLAANRGYTPAKDQLRALAAGPAGKRAWPQDYCDWETLAKETSIADWLTPPEKIVVAEEPRLRRFPAFISPAICRRLIVAAAGRTTQALVYDAETGRGKVEASRSNTALEFTILDLDVVLALVRARISAVVEVPVAAFEPPQVMRYEVGQKFDWHYDFIVGDNPGYAKDLAARGQRILTALIYLNDAYEGGATEFPKAGVSFRGAVGDALIFSNVDRSGEPDPATLHAGAAPTQGTKWLFSQWIRDRALGQTE